MSKKIQIVDADVARKETKKRKSPAALLLESLEGDYITMREMAEEVGVHIETMRRLCRAVDDNGDKLLAAPSKAVRSGGMTIYLFTKEDQQEVKNHFTKKGYVMDA